MASSSWPKGSEVKYLASGMIRGIGPVYAKKLLHAFGDTVFDLIETEPGRLRDVDGIGPVRANRTFVGWAEQKVVREIMVFLHSHGIGSAREVRIYKTYGANAAQVISENPYRRPATSAASASRRPTLGLSLADMIASAAIPVELLTEVLRQARVSVRQSYGIYGPF
jgi:ATP-dependent exoDNAse (exonuclease V) alpha subunit